MKIRITYLSLVFILLITGCVKPVKTADPAEFAEFISGFTSGVISKKDPVRIKIAPGKLKFETGKSLPDGIFSFDPSVKGSASLYAEDLLIFQPETSWPAGKTVRASLNLGKLIEVPDKFSTFNFQFSIIQPSFSVYPGNLVSTGDSDKKMKRAEGKLVSADAMELKDVRNLLSASSQDVTLNVRWETGAGLNEFEFVIDSLPRKEEPYQVELAWNGDPLGIDLEGSYIYEIPSIYDFLYLGYHASQGDEQYIDIMLSDPPDPSQDLNGLVYLKEGDPVRLVTDNNVIRLYPAQRLEGSRTLIVENSVRCDARATLKQRVEVAVLFEELKPAAEFIGQGTILPDPEGLFLPIRTVSLKAVDVIVYKIFENNIPYYLQDHNFTEDGFYNFRQFGRPVYARTILLDEDKSVDLRRWNNYSLDLSPLIDRDPGAIYRVKLFFRKEYAVFQCESANDGDISKFILDGTYPPEKMEDWDSPEWFREDEWPEDYRWDQRDNPCHNSYYNGNRFKQKLILASRIGVMAKSADGKQFVIHTTDLISGEPLADVNIGFYNYQNQPVGNGTTDPVGKAEITLDSRPFYLKAYKENQQTWLRLDDGTSLSLSHFDVGGAEVQKGLKGMIYGERGVWRPGDTLFLTFILDDIQNPLPSGHPVQLEVFNSRGQLAYSTKKSTGTDGFFVFSVPTDPEAPTGTWRALVRAGGASFEKNLKIETVKPNRLKILLDFNQEVLNMFSQKPQGKLEVRWLHGAVSPAVRTNIDLSFRKTRTSFTGFEKYTFENPATYFWAEERNIFNKETDNQGKAAFDFELPEGENAPGMMDAVFLVRAFEKGGDFSTDVFTRQFSPFKKYIGIHVPDGGSYENMLETDKDHVVKVASVDWKGMPVTSRGLEVKVYRIQWRWWWSSGEEDLAYYIGSHDAELIYQGVVDAENGTGSFNLRINYPEWGRYLILVKDPEGGHQAGLPVYFDWPSYVNRSGRTNPAGATMLTFSAGKEKYLTGENAVISFPATPGSRALISIESGSRILSSQWKMCRETEETFEVEITEGMAPNVYVYLSLIQPHQQTANDLPIRMYGVIPLLIEDPSTLLKPVISMPEELRPEEDFTVKISEKDGKPMTFTIAVVDDGLLDLTRFKTPDPHSVFYAREALGVKTWDMFDLVLGAYGGRLGKVLAIGGDEEAMLAKNKKAQRFIPVVRYAGPFSLNKGEKKEIRLHMPNYVGSVRTMVIAGKDGAYGNVEKTTPVRKPLMVLATLPRVLGPGEEVELPVSVFAMNDDIKEVEVKIDVDEMLVPAVSSQRLSFTQAGEQMAYFRLKVNEMTGTGKIRVTATSGKETAFQEFEVGVRNPNPFITKTLDTIVEPGKSLRLPYSFFGMYGTNSGKVTFSGLPDFGLDRHLVYLIRYPYGCLEQTVSSVFPQLYLSDLTDLSQENQILTDRNIRAAINRISRMALADGSMTYWPGQVDANNWSTSYAGHFLVMAAAKGYLLPPGLLEKWMEYQYRSAGSYQSRSTESHSWEDLSQAYRLYTLALAQKPNLSAMNRMRESGRLSPSSAWILATAYLYAGKPEVAEELIAGRETGVTDTYNSAGYTYGSGLRDKAFILEALAMLKKDTEAFRLMEQMAENLKYGLYSTQTTSFCLYAIARFAGKSAGNGMAFDYMLNNAKNENVRTAKSLYMLDLEENSRKDGNIQVKNNSPDSRLFVNVTLTGQPVQGLETEQSSNLKISVVYKTDNGNILDAGSLKQGTDFIAEVTVEHAGLVFDYNEMALSQVFPSGWEIINTRVQDVNAGLKEDIFDYRDIRDDRVYTFFDLGRYTGKTFRVRLNAAYTGRYYLPAVACEAMYETNIHANNKGRWVEVVR
ncbi:MAG: MG2 domain-containing protein [Bacteroidales bacterium]|nr:MG2 domain-containing protein [Bacteroidales bacterium]